MMSKIKKLVFILAVILTASVSFSGCSIFNTAATSQTNVIQTSGSQTVGSQTQATQQATADPKIAEYDMAFQKLLPSRAGFKWKYFGIAEYGQTMKLISVVQNNDEATYTITGQIDDMSGGGSGAPAGAFDISVTYVIGGGALLQDKKGDKMMDSDADRIELLRGPLTLNNKWTQEVVKKDGKKITLECQITDIKDDNGVKTYSVYYKDNGSNYYEKRQIKDGIGVVSFEKLWTDQDNKEYPISYSLATEMTGY